MNSDLPTSARKTIATILFLHRAIRKRLPTFFRIVSSLGRGRLRLQILHPYSQLAGDQICLIPSAGYFAVPLTRSLDSPLKTNLLRSGEIRAFEAESVIFEPQSEILSQGARYFRQPLVQESWRSRRAENLYSASSLILWNSARFCLSEVAAGEALPTIPEGILLNGQACNNWYHWLINILPRVFIAETFLNLPPEIPYLVSKSIEGTRMEEALRLIIGHNKKVLFLEDRPHKVGKGVVIETPVREIYRPKNVLSAVHWANTGSFHPTIMTAYRNHLIKLALHEGPGLPPVKNKNIFLERDNVSRPFNQTEVKAMLEGHNFTPIKLEELPFREQVLTMANARVVIGPTGAQWAGWLFTERALGIILVPSFLTASSLFSKLGVAGSSELLEVPMRGDSLFWAQYDGSRAPAKVSTAELASVLLNLLAQKGVLMESHSTPHSQDK